ncbi:MAG: hypothetical protein M3092_03535 [Actinomycetia bacterium]|nr:hypothetical protein [Actinomycetes bacterium]
MLRESALAYDYNIDLRAIADPSIHLGVPGGNTLLQFIDAMTGASSVSPSDARRAVVDELGPEALVDAAAVFGNFAMMNRIAEGTGIPLAKQAEIREQDLIATLGLDRLKKH